MEFFYVRQAGSLAEGFVCGWAVVVTGAGQAYSQAAEQGAEFVMAEGRGRRSLLLDERSAGDWALSRFRHT